MYTTKCTHHNLSYNERRR